MAETKDGEKNEMERERDDEHTARTVQRVKTRVGLKKEKRRLLGVLQWLNPRQEGDYRGGCRTKSP